MTNEFARVLHGGVGTLRRGAMSAARTGRYHDGLRRALTAGRAVLAAGGSDELGRVGGSGGLVAVGREGDAALPFNCSGMYRGYVKSDGIVYTAIYHELYRSA